MTTGTPGANSAERDAVEHAWLGVEAPLKIVAVGFGTGQAATDMVGLTVSDICFADVWAVEFCLYAGGGAIVGHAGVCAARILHAAVGLYRTFLIDGDRAKGVDPCLNAGGVGEELVALDRFDFDAFTVMQRSVFAGTAVG